MANDDLKKLHTAIIDARHGYEEAAMDAETPELSTLFQEMGALHDKHHADIHKALVDAGEQPDEEGSFMTTVHAGIISLRASITGLKSALSSFASGEERLIEMYDDVLKASPPPAVTTMLTGQKTELQSRIPAMKAMETEPS